MTIKYVFVVNNIYNAGTIKRVRWWNRLIGFPGLTVVATCEMNLTHFTEDTFNMVKAEFEEYGFYEQVMGEMI